MTKREIFNISANILFISALCISFSGRSLTGVTIFNFRIGEMIVGSLFILSIFALFYKSQDFKKELLVFKIIIVIYFLSLLFVDNFLLTTYLIESSSYIWMISLFFLSLTLSKFIKADSWFFIFYLILPFLLYFTEAISYPEFLENFYIQYSDKFDFLKGSDLALIVISAQIFSILKLKKSFNTFIYIIFVNALFLPFLLYKSKGAFLGASLFFIVIFIKNSPYAFSRLKNILVMSAGVLIFMVSINHVSQLNLYGDDSPISYVEQTASNLESIVDSKNTRAIFSSLYIQDGRLFSTENNANWRLEIWQDVIFNLYESEQLYFGYGYSDKIPEMELPHRQGTDGTNENVHNFIINIFARGGLFGVVPYLAFILFLLIRSVKKSDNYLIVLYVCSIFAISFFGATNESVRYPFIFYTFLGYYFNNLDKTYKYKLLK